MTTRQGLIFRPSNHTYTLDGTKVPGVTTLIGKGLPKPALVYWSAKAVAEWVADNEAGLEQMRGMGRGPMVAALKAVPWEARDTAAVRGTHVHTIAEKLVHGQEVEVPAHLSGYVDGYVKWLDAARPEPLWTERPVLNRKWWYAGTFDLIATLAGETWLLDVKTAKGVYGDNAIQLAAYANAECLINHDGTETPMPSIARLGVLHVQDGETTLYPVTDPAAAWKDALHIFWVAKAADRIKGYIGEPIDTHETSGDAA